MILTNTFDDFMESVALVNRVNRGSIEPQVLHKGALDVLAHNIVSSLHYKLNTLPIE